MTRCPINFDDLDGEINESVPKAHRDLVKRLCDIESGLQHWEVNFVESVARRVDHGWHLTPGEIAQGEKILKRIEDQAGASRRQNQEGRIHMTKPASNRTPPPADLWDTKPGEGKYLVFLDSKLSGIAITVHPSRKISDKILVLDNDVWLRATLRMVGWAYSRIDLMLTLTEDEKVTQAQYDDFKARIDTLCAWVNDSESFAKEALDWAWENRLDLKGFKPPFDHYRAKLITEPAKATTKATAVGKRP